MEIAKDRVVTMHYTLRAPDGAVLDSSEGKDPLSYLHGHGNLIQGLESRIEGKSAGDSMNVKVPAAEAYGEIDPERKMEVPRDRFPADAEIEPGAQFQAQSEAGPLAVRVEEVKGDTVVIDANHPLAGVDLDFTVEVVEIREATDEEKDHGHAH